MTHLMNTSRQWTSNDRLSGTLEIDPQGRFVMIPPKKHRHITLQLSTVDHDQADVLCVEGSHEAISQSLLPPNKIVEHDYSLGPWWPSKTYDACWCVEFLEHVSRHYIRNYLPSFHKCAIVFTTRSEWGGYHHVEVLIDTQNIIYHNK